MRTRRTAVEHPVRRRSSNVDAGAAAKLNLARDSRGAWRASVSVVPGGPSRLDPGTVLIARRLGGWVVFDTSTSTGTDTGELPVTPVTGAYERCFTSSSEALPVMCSTASSITHTLSQSPSISASPSAT